MAANIIRNFDSCLTLEGALFLAPDDNDESDRVALITIRLFSEISTMQLFFEESICNKWLCNVPDKGPPQLRFSFFPNKGRGVEILKY